MMPSKTIYVAVEATSFLCATVLAVAWYFDPTGNWEPAIVLFMLIGSGVELFRRSIPKKAANRFATNGQRIQHQEKLREVFRAEILQCRAENLRQDVIVRHVDRFDQYPEIDPNATGISPWFKAYLLDTYERGIVLGLRMGGLKTINGGFRYVDSINGEKADVHALLMVDIPYDSIERVNIEGDEYYHYPHIYCYFDFEGEPYERKWFAQKIMRDHGHPYFKQIATYEDVVKNNPAEGKLYFA